MVKVLLKKKGKKLAIRKDDAGVVKRGRGRPRLTPKLEHESPKSSNSRTPKSKASPKSAQSAASAKDKRASPSSSDSNRKMKPSSPKSSPNSAQLKKKGDSIPKGGSKKKALLRGKLGRKVKKTKKGVLLGSMTVKKGRPRKDSASVASESGTPKKRGRPRKLSTEEASSSSSTPASKRPHPMKMMLKKMKKRSASAATVEEKPVCTRGESKLAQSLQAKKKLKVKVEGNSGESKATDANTNNGQHSEYNTSDYETTSDEDSKDDEAARMRKRRKKKRKAKLDSEDNEAWFAANRPCPEYYDRTQTDDSHLVSSDRNGLLHYMENMVTFPEAPTVGLKSCLWNVRRGRIRLRLDCERHLLSPADLKEFLHRRELCKKFTNYCGRDTVDPLAPYVDPDDGIADDDADLVVCMNTYQRLCTEDHDEEVKEAMDRPVKLAIRAAERVTGGEHPSHAARLQYEVRDVWEDFFSKLTYFDRGDKFYETAHQEYCDAIKCFDDDEKRKEEEKRRKEEEQDWEERHTVSEAVVADLPKWWPKSDFTLVTQEDKDALSKAFVTNETYIQAGTECKHILDTKDGKAPTKTQVQKWWKEMVKRQLENYEKEDPYFQFLKDSSRVNEKVATEVVDCEDEIQYKPPEKNEARRPPVPENLRLKAESMLEESISAGEILDPRQTEFFECVKTEDSFERPVVTEIGKVKAKPAAEISAILANRELRFFDCDDAKNRIIDITNEDGDLVNPFFLSDKKEKEGWLYAPDWFPHERRHEECKEAIEMSFAEKKLAGILQEDLCRKKGEDRKHARIRNRAAGENHLGSLLKPVAKETKKILDHDSTNKHEEAQVWEHVVVKIEPGMENAEIPSTTGASPKKAASKSSTPTTTPKKKAAGSSCSTPGGDPKVAASRQESPSGSPKKMAGASAQSSPTSGSPGKKRVAASQASPTSGSAKRKAAASAQSSPTVSAKKKAAAASAQSSPSNTLSMKKKSAGKGDSPVNSANECKLVFGKASDSGHSATDEKSKALWRLRRSMLRLRRAIDIGSDMDTDDEDTDNTGRRRKKLARRRLMAAIDGEETPKENDEPEQFPKKEKVKQETDKDKKKRKASTPEKRDKESKSLRKESKQMRSAMIAGTSVPVSALLTRVTAAEKKGRGRPKKIKKVDMGGSPKAGNVKDAWGWLLV